MKEHAVDRRTVFHEQLPELQTKPEKKARRGTVLPGQKVVATPDSYRNFSRFYRKLRFPFKSLNSKPVKPQQQRQNIYQCRDSIIFFMYMRIMRVSQHILVLCQSAVCLDRETWFLPNAYCLKRIFKYCALLNEALHCDRNIDELRQLYHVEAPPLSYLFGIVWSRPSPSDQYAQLLLAGKFCYPIARSICMRLGW